MENSALDIANNSSVSSCDSPLSCSPIVNKNPESIYIIDGETEWTESEAFKLQHACGTLPVLIVDLDNTLVHSDAGDQS